MVAPTLSFPFSLLRGEWGEAMMAQAAMATHPRPMTAAMSGLERSNSPTPGREVAQWRGGTGRRHGDNPSRRMAERGFSKARGRMAMARSGWEWEDRSTEHGSAMAWCGAILVWRQQAVQWNSLHTILTWIPRKPVWLRCSRVHRHRQFRAPVCEEQCVGIDAWAWFYWRC